MKTTTWKYHVSHSFVLVESKTKITLATQLYQIGTYAIVNNDPSMQLSMTPAELSKLEKKLKKDEAAGIISELKFGREITVTKNNDGFFEEVK